MEEDILNERRNKLNKILELGIDPYPAVSNRTHFCSEIIDNEKLLTDKDVTVCGRIFLFRPMGKAGFATIRDESGEIQIYFKLDDLLDNYQLIKLLDLGDIIEVQGFVFRTQKGELTVHAKNITLLTKTLRPLPDKFHGLKDVESKYRERYVDLMVNTEEREVVKLRAKLLASLRNNLNEAGFIEVETPMLQPIASGAIARPFSTHYNAYDSEVFLRIAPELYLKRLVVGGFEKVYEMGRCFRNEGADWSHNPEFTMLEFYAAYYDYEKLMDFTKVYLLKVFKDLGISQLSFEGNTVDVNKGWNKISFRDAILKETKIDFDKLNAIELFEEAKKLGLKDIKKDWGKGKLIDELYKEFVRPKIIEPTFIIHHPIELSPLAKKLDNNHVQRFQLVILGTEILNAYSELNDPVDQAERFLLQSKTKGDEETMPADTDFVRALEFGLPPTAGWGMGIDRMMLLLSGQSSVREVITFPFMRPKKDQ